MRQRLMLRGLTWLLPSIYYLRLLGWWLLRPVTLGARVLVVDGDQVLLVRSHGNTHWHLPGGAVKRREPLAEAARRETYEETGCPVEIDRLLGVYSNFREWKSDHSVIFVGHPAGPVNLKINLEIAEARYFPLNALPAGLSEATARRIEEYTEAQWGKHGAW